MIAIPAIDLIDGRCVRLTEGAFDSVRIYGNDPVAVARDFADAGARRLHVVDLDAARGTGNNLEVLRQIRRVFPSIMDVGGGIRSLEYARSLVNLGVDFLVVGTVLARNPQLVADWADELGPVLVAGIDARDGQVKISGWESSSQVMAVDLAAEASGLGVVEIIYTDISRDGTLKGPNITETAAVARSSGLPVVISGGVGSMDDLRTLAGSPPPGISGVIMGKALYEGRVDLKEAVRLLGGAK